MAKKRDVWTENFANNARVRDAVKNIFPAKIQNTRDSRYTLEEDWMRFVNMWDVQHDDSHMYNGRAKLYIPEVRKCVEAQARQLVELAFPTDDFITCYPMPGGTTRGADVQQSIRRWQVEQSNLKGRFLVFARQQAMLGTSPAYVCWDKKVDHAFKQARNPKTGKIKISRQLVETFNGPTFIPRDLFKWYAINPKKMEFEEDGTIELRVVDRAYVESQAKLGMIFGMDEILGGNSDAWNKDVFEKDIRRAEMMGLQIDSKQGYAGTASLKEGDENKMGNYELATIYARVICPEACLEDEDPTVPIPMKIEIYNGEHVGFVGRNPFFHQKPPYVVGRYIYPNADEFYGQGIPKAVQYQQYELNSKAEQAMDSITLSLNPIAMIDPGMAAQNGNFEIEPGATWFVSPNGVRLDRMPDVSQSGYAAISQLRSQIQDYSDREPALPSQLSGKARTATAANQVGEAQSVDFNTFKRQNEQDVLIPLMEQWEALTTQHSEEEFIIMVLGRSFGEWKQHIVNKEQFAGNYKYMWKAASDFDNRAVKARQMIDMMKVAGSLPPESQAKLGFDFAEAYRILWKEIMRLPNSDKVIPDPMAMPVQDPEVIFRMLELGMDVEVLPTDNNMEFLRMYSEKYPTVKNEEMKRRVMQQVIEHKKMLEKKQQVMQQLQEQKQQQMQMALAEQQGKRPSSGTQGSGNRTQLSPNANAGDVASGVRS